MRTNLFILSRFWTTHRNFDNCCLRYIATCGNFFYKVHIYIHGPKYCSGIFFKSLNAVVRTAHKLSADFWPFRIFDGNFVKIVAPPSGKNENYVVHLKERSILKKALKTALKLTHKPSHKTYLNYVPDAQADQA